MPNWCTNSLTVTHEDPAELQRFADAWNSGELFQTLIPRPRDLDIVSSPGTTDEELQVLYSANQEKYGYTSWYEWNVSNWGTKWDVGRAEHEEPVTIDQGSIDISFDSAWSPPVGAYEKLSEQGFEIVGYYYEPGCGFCGCWTNDHDDYYDFNGLSSADVKEQIPEDIDAMFGISESMAEWEEENEESNQ